MLKNYIWRGLEWQFEEGTQPKEAVEPKPAEPSEDPADAARLATESDAGDPHTNF